MQVVDKKNVEKRILYYWSKIYTQGIKESQDYEKLEKCFKRCKYSKDTKISLISCL